MVQTGHREDGPNGHSGGKAVDCWPLASRSQDDWLDASTASFEQFLYAWGHSQWSRQTGVVGDGSDSATNLHYASKGYVERGVYVDGVSVFVDEGGAHVHLGSV